MTRRTHRSSIPPVVVVALALSACAVGPDYEPPEVPVPDAWQSAAVEGLTEGTATLLGYQAIFVGAMAGVPMFWLWVTPGWQDFLLLDPMSE